MDNDNIANIFIKPDFETFLEVLLIIFGALLLIQAIQRLFPWIANRLHGASRLFILAMIPPLRLILILTAFILIIPRFIEPSLQNLIPLDRRRRYRNPCSKSSQRDHFVAGRQIIGYFHSTLFTHGFHRISIHRLLLQNPCGQPSTECGRLYQKRETGTVQHGQHQLFARQSSASGRTHHVANHSSGHCR